MSGEAPQEVAPSGPLVERLGNKVWKWRLAAYEELNTLFQTAEDGKAKAFFTYGLICLISGGNVILAIASDSNAVSLETGLEAVYTFVDRADAAPKLAPQLLPLLIEKCLGARPKTKQRATDIMLLFVEIDCSAPVIEALLTKGVNHKVPKVCAAAINILTQALRLYGSKVINVRTILPAFTSWFSHRDQAVREEAFALVTELQRWVGAAVEPKLEELTPVQAKELRDRFSQSQGPAVPQKLTRSQADAAFAPVSEPEAEVDPFEFMEEVDVISKLPADWFDKLQEKKWQDRKKAMKQLLELLESPRYKPADYRNIQMALKKVITSDINVMVVQDAIEAVGKLCAGLRKHFAKDAKELAGALLARFKEKKATVVTALQATMLNLAQCLNVPDDVIEEITEAASHKVPAVKEQMWLWLVECVKAPKLWYRQFKSMKQLGALLVAALDDPSPTVRNYASEVFGRLAGVVGERVLSPYLAKLDDVRQKKVREFFPAAPKPGVVPVEVIAPAPAPAPTPAAPAPTPAAAPAQPSRPTAKSALPKKTAAPAAAAAPASAPAKERAAAAPAKAKGKPAAKKAAGPTMEITAVMSHEEASTKAGELFTEALITQLASSVWKDRLVATEELVEIINKWTPEQCTENYEAVVRQLEYKPSLKDSNLQVLHTVITAMDAVCKKATAVSTGIAASILPGIADKLPDAKTKVAGSCLLTTLCIKVSPHFVFAQLFDIGTATKNQKVPPAILTWMKSLLEEFRVPLQILDLVNFLKVFLNGSNIPAKNVALDLVLLLRRCAGPDLMNQLNDLKPALLDSIKKKLEALPSLDPPNLQPLPGQDTENVPAGMELPREDISKEISPELLAKLDNKQQWQVKQEAVEEVRAIITGAGKRILPDGLGNLFAALKGRLDDSNQNIVKNSIDLLAELAEALGPDGTTEHAKVAVPALMGKYSFNKPQIREAAVRAVDIWTKEVGAIHLLPFVPAILAVENSASRKECLTWLVKQLETAKLKRADAAPLGKAVLLCLEDKMAEVRHLSEQALKPIMRVSGFDSLSKALSQLKPASSRTLMPILTNIRTALKDEAPAAAPTPAAAAAKAEKPSPAVQEPIAPTKPAHNPNAVFFGDAAGSKQARLTEDRLAFAGADHRARADAKRHLGTAMRPHIAGPLLAKMFNPNGPERAEAARTLADLCRSKAWAADMTGAADLLLSWVSIQIFEDETEAAVLNSMFDFLEAFIDLLASVQYQLSDGESLLVLPYLIELMGRAPAPVCRRIQNAIKLITTIYPASKVFKFVLEGIKTENSGSVFCLESLGSLINRHGGLAMLQPAVLLLIAKHIGTEALRPAALNCLADAHQHLQGRLWTSLGGIPPAHLSLLQQHVAAGKKEPEAPRQLPVQEKAENPARRRMRKCITILSRGHEDEAHYVEALKQVCMALEADRSAGLESASEIVSILTPAVGSALGSSATRLSKYVLNTLVTFISACLPDTLSKESLENLIVELTDKLADKAVPLQPDGRYITMALNQLVLKVLDRCDYTTCFTTLVNSLTREMVQSGPLVDLHMKCILKLTKQVGTRPLNTTLLLRSLNDFLAEVPQPPPKGSMPLKTINSVLSELCKVHGETINSLLDFEPTPLLATYTRMILARNASEPASTIVVQEPAPAPEASAASVSVSASESETEPDDAEEADQPEPAAPPDPEPTAEAEPEPEPEIAPEPVPKQSAEPTPAKENSAPAPPKISTADLVTTLRGQLKALNGQDPLSPSLVQAVRAPLPIQQPPTTTSLNDLRARLANLQRSQQNA